MMRRITPLVAVATATTLMACGCSDDLVCPELPDAIPYISALVVQRSGDEEGTTHAEVLCTADPLPSVLITFINGRELHVVVPPQGLDVLATMDDNLVLWQPGTRCSLEVTTDYGYATAAVDMPHAAAVTAPTEISLGDELELLWEGVTDADYYVVSAVLVTDEDALLHGAPGGRDTLVLSMITRKTFAVFLPESLTSTGVVSGFVETVAGPFPESGAAGNVSGDGWGFFTLRYRDSGSAFEVIVSDAP
jgi:hypothetical protein